MRSCEVSALSFLLIAPQQSENMSKITHYITLRRCCAGKFCLRMEYPSLNLRLCVSRRFCPSNLCSAFLLSPRPSPLSTLPTLSTLSTRSTLSALLCAHAPLRSTNLPLRSISSARLRTASASAKKRLYPRTKARFSSLSRSVCEARRH